VTSLDLSFLVALACEVVTCTFDASQSEISIIFDVPISLTICTLSNIPFAFFEQIGAILSHLTTVLNKLT
jgi:hypothetical protein